MKYMLESEYHKTSFYIKVHKKQNTQNKEKGRAHPQHLLTAS